MLRLLLVTSVLGFLALGMAGDGLSYRERGHRHEGVKPKPIDGYTIELLGAMAEPIPSPSADFSDRAAVSFYLERDEPVHLFAREREPEDYYWLDRVKQPSPWRQRATNTFSWPSGDVLRPLGLRPADLLVLVRLGPDKPRSDERVAPVLLELAAGGRKVGGYRFTFRTQAAAKIRHAVYGPASEPLEPFTPHVQRAAAVPFEISWKANDKPEGTYRLVLQGYFTADNRRLAQSVEFFHQPAWPD